MSIFVRRSHRGADVVDALRAMGDGLRAGLSLRNAIIRTAGAPGSPLAPAAAALVAGQPLVPVLQTAAAMPDNGGDAGLSSALCVLAVHAEAGGDPLPAVRALAERLARRAAARDEAKALTTQARLGARVMLFLTPGFLLLLLATDAHGLLQSFGQTRTRAAFVLGLVLQGVGAVWIGAIVRTAGGEPARIGSVPFLRAIRAVAAGRPRASDDVDVADTAEAMSFALDAGLAPSAALSAVAPYAPGPMGEALRETIADIGAPTHAALKERLPQLGAAAERFADAFHSSVVLGVPLAPSLRSLADDLREQTSIGLAEDVRRASVRVLLPLGLVVLPAFVLACLVPLFVGGLQGIAG